MLERIACNMQGLLVIVFMLYNREPSITKDTIVEDSNPKNIIHQAEQTPRNFL